MSLINLSIIIPVFNSDKSLIKLTEQIKKLKLKNYEIIFVDDHSKNYNTKKTLLQLSEQNKKLIKSIFLSKNFGRTKALLTGLEYATGKYFIIMDDDLQHNPKHIINFMKFKSHDIVMANYKRKKNYIDNFFSYLKYLLDKNTFNTSVRISSYFLINKYVRNNIVNTNQVNPYLPGLLFSISNDFKILNIELENRKFGESNYNFFKKLKIIKDVFLNHSRLPYKVFFLIGFLSLFFSASFIVSVFIKYFNYTVMPGWSSIISIIILFGSINMILLSFIGYFVFLKTNDNYISSKAKVRHTINVKKK